MSGARRSHGLAEAANNIEDEIDIPLRPLAARPTLAAAPQPQQSQPQAIAPPPAPAPLPIVSPIRTHEPDLGGEDEPLPQHDASRVRLLAQEKFPPREPTRKTSLDIPMSLDRVLQTHVDRLNLRGSKVTRAAVMVEALKDYFGVIG